MNVKTVNYSLYEAYKAGEIDLHEAARLFHYYGWTNYVDMEYTKREFNRIALENV